MKVRIVWPMLYVDVNVWVIYEDPTTLEPVLFKTPMDLTLVRSFEEGGPLTKLTNELKARFGQEIEIEDLGYWDNTKTSDGWTTHPFTKEKCWVGDGKTTDVAESDEE